MPRKRKTNKHLPAHVYIRRGRYQLRYKNGRAKNFDTVDECLVAWAREYDCSQSDLISDIITDYRATVLPTKAIKTQKEYAPSLDRLNKACGHFRLSELRPKDVYQYQAARASGGAGVAANRDIAVLSVVCAHGVRLGHADRNVCREVRRYTERPRKRYVTDEEVEIVYGLASEWMKRAIRLVCLTGMRLQDLWSFSQESMTDEGLLYEQEKTGRRMLMVWTDELRWCAKRPPVSYEGFTTAWQRLMRKALDNGLEERFTFHDLRAKAGSESEDWRILGHTDRRTFERIYNRKPVRIVLDSDRMGGIMTAGKPET